MSNRERKLSTHQKPIWRKAFEASMVHTSIENAERKAWQAVDIWEKVGAFNEPDRDEVPDVYEDYLQVISDLIDVLGKLPPHTSIDSQKLFDRLRKFHIGDLDPDEFKYSLGSLLDSDV